MPASPIANPYLYFMYSYEHVERRNEIEKEMGKRFECGNVVVAGKRKKFSYLAKSASSRDSFIKNYPDAKLIAQGYSNKVNYTDAYTTTKRSN